MQHSKSKKILRGPSPMVAPKSGKASSGCSKQIYAKPISYRENAKYPSHTSISTSTSTKNLKIKPIAPVYEIENPELLKKISSYYKLPYKY